MHRMPVTGSFRPGYSGEVKRVMNIILISVFGMLAAIALMLFLFRPYDYGGGQGFLKIGGRPDNVGPHECEWRSAYSARA